MPDEAAIVHYLTHAFEGVHVEEAMRAYFFFFGPMGDDNKFPFATLVTDDTHDQASDLSRPGVFRLNIGVSKATFLGLFGQPVGHASDTGLIDSGYDYTALDQLMPHPVYGNMYWLCVLNPSAETWEKVKPLLAEAYAAAARSHTQRQPSQPDAKPN